jgi:hypothetical protein
LPSAGAEVLELTGRVDVEVVVDGAGGVVLALCGAGGDGVATAAAAAAATVTSKG